MRWTALVENANHVCCRYRLCAFAPAFARAGLELRVVPLPRSFLARQKLISTLSGQHVLLQRRLLDVLSWRRLRRAAAHIVFDFDDAVWLRDSYSSRGLSSWRRARRFERTVREADAVIAGNPFLAEAATRFTNPRHVHVVPTCVNPGRYTPAAHSNPDRVRLVWIGSSSTLQGLEQIADVLDSIGTKLPHVALRLVCDRRTDFGRLEVEYCAWREDAEAEWLAGADIGISWLPDDDWSRGKCGLKVLQYQAAGLPVVANPVGVQCHMVRPAQNGYLPQSRQHWLEIIGQLAADCQLRRRLGKNGRRQVEQHYAVETVAPQLLAALRTPCRSETAVPA